MRDVSFSIERGDFFGLLGPNGAGKTTLLKVLTGQIRATSGEAEVLGLPVAQQPLEVRSRAGIVPEQSTPPSFLTPREVLELVVAVRGCEVDVEWWLEFFEFEEAEGRICRTLSRGQRQKVMLAAAFIAQPEVLFLDEPTAGVSPIVMDELFDRIIEVSRTGLPILMVEQNAKQALEIADKGYVLVQGANAYTGTGQELLADPEVRKSFLGG